MDYAIVAGKSLTCATSQLTYRIALLQTRDHIFTYDPYL